MVLVDGQMVEALHVDQARRVLELAAFIEESSDTSTTNGMGASSIGGGR